MDSLNEKHLAELRDHAAEKAAHGRRDRESLESLGLGTNDDVLASLNRGRFRLRDRAKVADGIRSATEAAEEEPRLPLPDVMFPTRYLGDGPLSTRDIVDGADGLVYGIDSGGKATHRPGNGEAAAQFDHLFRELYEASDPSPSPALKASLMVFRSSRMRKRLTNAGLSSPYVQSDGLADVIEFAFGRRLHQDTWRPGSPYFYAMVAPVYEFLHRVITGLSPELEPRDVRQLGGIPLLLLPTAKLRPDVGLLGNDALGRRNLARQAVQLLADRRAANPQEVLRVLAVGDGPALTSLLLMRHALERDIDRVDVTIIDPADGQIANGQRTFEEMDSRLRDRFRDSDIHLRWIQAGTQDMGDFEESRFDLVFSSYVVGALGTETVAKQYANEAIRVLKPDGKHVVLDFYDGRDMKVGYRTTNGASGQRGVRATANLTRFLMRAPLHQCYLEIWGHVVSLSDAMIDASRQAGATWTRSHRQTWFAHLPLLRLGRWTLTASLPGYNEMTSTFSKPGQET